MYVRMIQSIVVSYFEQNVFDSEMFHRDMSSNDGNGKMTYFIEIYYLSLKSVGVKYAFERNSSRIFWYSETRSRLINFQWRSISFSMYKLIEKRNYYKNIGTRWRLWRQCIIIYIQSDTRKKDIHNLKPI